MLRNVLEAIAETPDRDALVPWPSSEVRVSVATVANQLAPAGLLERLSDRKIELTDQARQWLANSDNAFLISVFHDNIRFVGEFLSELQASGLTREQLLGIASQKYRLGWSTLDQVIRRSVWLQVTGMVELRYDHNMVLTENGSALLATLDVTDPVVIALGFSEVDVDPASLPVPDSRIQEMLEKITDESLRVRLTPGLYIPKGRNSGYDSLTSLRIQLDGIGPRISKDDYVRLCSAEFGSKESSAISALDTLRHTGLVQQTGFNTFDTTVVAQAWLESGEDLDLVRILHAHVRCVVELITLLNEPTSIAQLIEEIEERYGVRLNNPCVNVCNSCASANLSTMLRHRPTWRPHVAVHLPVRSGWRHLFLPRNG